MKGLTTAVCLPSSFSRAQCAQASNQRSRVSRFTGMAKDPASMHRGTGPRLRETPAPGNNPSSVPTNIASSTATSMGERPQDFYQHLESSLDAVALAIARFISAIRQALDIGAYALLFAIDCTLLATVLFFYSSIIRQIISKFFLSFSR